MTDSRPPLGWIGIIPLGLVQTALGAIVVLTTSTLDRVMVVELALPAMLPGVLVALDSRCKCSGLASATAGCRWPPHPSIVGGIAVLAVGGVAAAVAAASMAANTATGIVLAAAAFLLIGAGVGGPEHPFSYC